jgi:cyclase
MLTKRIIPCLDVDNGRVVKGTNFVSLKDAGDPVEMGGKYSEEGADELVFLDITASHDKRDTVVEMVEQVAKQVFIPFTVGGGVRTTEDMRRILKAGADKVSINSAAILNPDLISEGACLFGNQCIVLAVDVKKVNNSYTVFTHGGRVNAEIDAEEWIKEGVRRGAGEILLTSMDKDGTKDGYDLDITKNISEHVPVPVIASGGAGKKEDFSEILTTGKADAALAASLFHFGEIRIAELKQYLHSQNIPVRQHIL